MSSKLRETAGDSKRKNMDVVSFHAEFFVACQNKTPTCTDVVTPAAPSDSNCWHTHSGALPSFLVRLSQVCTQIITQVTGISLQYIISLIVLHRH